QSATYLVIARGLEHARTTNVTMMDATPSKILLMLQSVTEDVEIIGACSCSSVQRGGRCVA
ncbi:MAG: hypothetical protein WKH64_19245, partial [Chloroflexia bacterium]